MALVGTIMRVEHYKHLLYQQFSFISKQTLQFVNYCLHTLNKYNNVI